MSCEYLEDAFAATMLDGVGSPVVPDAYWNQDGDCIEIRLAPESCRAERADGLVTVFIGRESSEVVGAVIKDVSKLVAKALEKAPGFRVEIMDQDGCQVGKILSLALWREDRGPDEACTVKRYKYLRDKAEENKLRVDLHRLAAEAS